MITLTREEAQQVLDALKEVNETGYSSLWKGAFDPEIELLRARLAQPEPEYRDVVIKGDLWRIEFLPDHAASVVLVKANYEAQPQPEPAAWMQNDMEHFSLWPDEWHVVPLYTAPPQREWQGLTDEEASQIWDGHIVPVFGKNGINPVVFARAIEAKLKAKNAS
jgi:hypothetical protein